MPKWNPWSGRGWANDRTRYSIRQSFQEIITGVLPTVGLDRFWHLDYTDRMFGGGAQSWDIFVAGDPPATGFYHSVALHNPLVAEPASAASSGIAPVELLVYRIDAWTGQGIPTVPGFAGEPIEWGRAGVGGPIRLFTVPDNYYDNSGAPAVTFTRSAQGGGLALHAWLQMGVGPGLRSLKLPNAHFDSGVHNIHPVISIGGVNHDARGPTMVATGSGASSFGFMGSDQPFLRLKPGQRLVAQTNSAITTVAAAEKALFASFWWVERTWGEEGGTS